ncbi:hypothetical protein KC19_7G093300 [Ceratodon purpureus]|uniref:Uncharacterized protein n=1 Tax=Ceratodon purpureus TaxID=3225 RepID=A0A8T0H4C1_CERPU|nr:hypothetical protein KC19_7G093300 [Ceratodon purpureus]
MVSFRDGGGSWCNGGRCSVTVGMSCLHRGKFGLVIAGCIYVLRRWRSLQVISKLWHFYTSKPVGFRN